MQNAFHIRADTQTRQSLPTTEWHTRKNEHRVTSRWDRAEWGYKMAAVRSGYDKTLAINRKWKWSWSNPSIYVLKLTRIKRALRWWRFPVDTIKYNGKNRKSVFSTLAKLMGTLSSKYSLKPGWRGLSRGEGFKSIGLRIRELEVKNYVAFNNTT